MAVSEIQSTLELEGWNSRHLLIEIMMRFNLFDWKLSWNRRTSNAFANAVAKDSLIKNFAILFCFDCDVVNDVVADSFFPNSFPSLFAEIAYQDLLGGAL